MMINVVSVQYNGGLRPDIILLVQTLLKQYNVGEKPIVILYTYITLIAMQGHQTKRKNRTKTR